MNTMKGEGKLAIICKCILPEAMFNNITVKKTQ